MIAQAAFPSPLAGLGVSLVGPGKVGCSLLHWLDSLGASIRQIGGRPGSRSAARAGRRFRAEAVPVERVETGLSDLLLLAVPDRVLPALAAELSSRPQASVVLHTAGGLDASVLAPLRKQGSAVGTFHPLRAFPGISRSSSHAKGVFFALEGDAEAEALGERLASALGGVAARIPPEARVAYHLAATLAAGGVTSTFATAWSVAELAGLPEPARLGLRQLARQALGIALRQPKPAAAITGPAVRGDLSTLLAHLRWLAEASPDHLELVVALARAALQARARIGPLDRDQLDLLSALAERSLTRAETEC